MSHRSTMTLQGLSVVSLHRDRGGVIVLGNEAAFGSHDDPGGGGVLDNDYYGGVCYCIRLLYYNIFGQRQKY